MFAHGIDICSLLTHNMDRLGRTGTEQVKGHRFFVGISWKGLHTRVFYIRCCLTVISDLVIHNELTLFTQNPVPRAFTPHNSYIPILKPSLKATFHKYPSILRHPPSSTNQSRAQSHLPTVSISPHSSNPRSRNIQCRIKVNLSLHRH